MFKSIIESNIRTGLEYKKRKVSRGLGAKGSGHRPHLCSDPGRSVARLRAMADAPVRPAPSPDAAALRGKEERAVLSPSPSLARSRSPSLHLPETEP